MNNQINGIEHIDKNNYSIFFISSLSNEFKSIIRSNLSSICHGPADAETSRPTYSYKNTLKEFIKRYKTKTVNQRKGMIGELLLHILLLEFLNDFQIDSPFFNLEERSVKKGFDVVLNKTDSNDLWIAEVKSGELHLNKDTSQTVVELIDTAKKDLDSRLNGDSISLWTNAVHGAKSAMQEYRDERKAIISILQDYSDAATEKTLTSQDINVILVGTIFNTLCDKIIETKISNKYDQVINTNTFNKVYLVAIQKETYTNVYKFLESESTI